MLENNVKFERNPDFIYRKIVDEYVLIPIHQQVADLDCIYTLNSVGASIWQLLEQPSPKEAIQAALLNEFDTSPEVLTPDLENFLQELELIGAIRRVG